MMVYVVTWNYRLNCNSILGVKPSLEAAKKFVEETGVQNLEWKEGNPGSLLTNKYWEAEAPTTRYFIEEFDLDITAIYYQAYHEGWNECMVDHGLSEAT